MNGRSLRMTLLFIGFASIVGAAFFTWTSYQAARADVSSVHTFDQHARAVEVAIADLRAAQQAYVAAGQGEDFWFARVTALEKEIDERLAAMRGLARSASAITEMAAATAALQDFSQMDARVREFTRNRQTTMASDAVFADGFELARKASDAVERAAIAEQVERDAVAFEGIRRQHIALAGAGSIAILGLLLLAPRPGSSQTAAGAAADLTPHPGLSDGPLSDLNDFGPAARPAPESARAAVELDEMASLCGDLARIADTRALPALLDRASTVLGANGIVLWIADPDGRELSPILVQGYPPRLANRFTTIGRDAENVTASAYRTGLLQTMKSDAVSNGAVAVPLVAPGGCVGVIA